MGKKLTPLITTALLFSLCVLAASCSSKKQFLGSIYEGAQMQQRQAQPPDIDAPEPAPNYDEYLRQRQEAIGKVPAGQSPETVPAQ